MANDKVYKYYTELPGWAKGVVIIGVLGVTYIVGSTIYKRIQRISSDAEEKSKLDQIQKELNSKKNSGQSATFTDIQFNNFADAAQNAFTNCRLPIVPCPTSLGIVCQSNSFREFYPIIKQLKNDVDFLQLQKSFGVRTITKSWACGGNIRMNLPTLVKDQLNSYEIKTINSAMSEKGITYSF
jgi:outer membrane murein-binding lipoprotein Lpp